MRWGFKEVPYLSAELSFIQGLFPQAQFLFIVRPIREQVRSHARAFRKPEGLDTAEGASLTRNRVETLVETWMSRHEDFLSFVNEPSVRSMVISYPQLTGDSGHDVLDKVFSFLDLDPPPADLIDEVLHHCAGALEQLWANRHWQDAEIRLVNRMVDECLPLSMLPLPCSNDFWLTRLDERLKERR